MPNVLITGARRGLGREFALQYAAAGWRVYACERDPRAVERPGPLSSAIHPVALDVEDAAAFAKASRAVAEPLDLLILNAGIYGPKPGGFGEIDYAAWERVLRVNVLGAMRTVETFLPHLERGRQKTIVAISSVMGSIGGNSSGSAYAYRSSKAALNMVVVNLANDLKAKDVIVVALHPGWVRTDMGGADALISPDRSVTDMRAVLAGISAADSGRFLSHDGRPLLW